MDSYCYMDSDESDEEWALLYELVINRRRRRRLMQQRPNVVPLLDDTEFRNRFRMSREAFWIVLQLVKEKIQHKITWNNALSPEEMLLLTLRYYATGCLQEAGGDRISKSTASRVIARVSHQIALLREKFIEMPSSKQELSQLQKDFYLTAKFPRVVAALGCTHVKIISPGGNDAKHFRNSKGFSSLNVQMLCDSNFNILNIVARWPGATHEATILENSQIKHRFEEREFGKAIVLAENVYASNNWLITPLNNASSPTEIRFNEAHMNTRKCINCCFRAWKRRFPVLSLGIRMNLKRVESIIVATAVLHNICNKKYETDVPDVSDEVINAINATLDIPSKTSKDCNQKDPFKSEIINYFNEIE